MVGICKPWSQDIEGVRFNDGKDKIVLTNFVETQISTGKIRAQNFRAKYHIGIADLSNAGYFVSDDGNISTANIVTVELG